MPNIHPLLTHFPIALLSFALLAEWAARILSREDLSRAGWWTQAAGSAGLAATALTGMHAADGVSIGAAGRASLEIHQEIAFLACAVFAVLLFWRIAARTKLPGGSETLFLLLFTAGVLLLWAGAWYGGEMVYRFGAGVQVGLPAASPVQGSP
ncbi:MAG TPA: DUF2231 domain-containing protein [Bacteroidota bacterium]|nr:DUF2231 domain-containing protein [Bacteroidota bacterium]